MKDASSMECKPFLRWAGGKTWFMKHSAMFLPRDFNRYHEPFLGSGAMFIHLKVSGILSKQSYLSDSNEELINCFQVVKTNVEELIERLGTFTNEESVYYEIRASKYTDAVHRAAQFIFLNRTSFNGIYRVNRLGHYNVPYGRKSYKQLFDFENLRTISELLQKTTIKAGDFEKSLKNVKENDFVFLDPPYTVAHENNGFVKYNQKIFSWEDQIRLKECLSVIQERKAKYVMTNASHVSITELFDNAKNIQKLRRASLIGGKGSLRAHFNELVFTNF